MSKIKTVMTRVKELLVSLPTTKDDDQLLVVKIWEQEFETLTDRGVVHVGDTSLITFLRVYRQGKITPADAITRARRKLQQHNVELRGHSFDKRHNVHEPNVRQEIRDLSQENAMSDKIDGERADAIEEMNLFNQDKNQ